MTGLCLSPAKNEAPKKTIQKIISKVTVLMLAALMTVSITGVKAEAANYPGAFFFKDDNFKEMTVDDSATVGDVVTFRILWLAVYNNEGYDMMIYNSNGQAVAHASKTFSNNTYRRQFFLTWETAGLPSGEYVLEVTKKFYSYYRWNEAPTKSKLYITLKAPSGTTPSTGTPNTETPSTEKKSTKTPGTETTNVKKPDNIKKLTVKSNGRMISIKYNKSRNATKYQIQYTMDKKFKKSVKTKTTSKTSCKITNLKRNKTYYVRVRAVNSKKVSSWTKVRKVRIKK